jgi:hypothetical protein
MVEPEAIFVKLNEFKSIITEKVRIHLNYIVDLANNGLRKYR